jgi:hypothetical protein
LLFDFSFSALCWYFHTNTYTNTHTQDDIDKSNARNSLFFWLTFFES